MRLNQKGFTLAELMIATGIFSLILLLCSTSVIVIGRQFHKTSVSITTQEASRNIMEEISRQVQLGGAPPSSTIASHDYGGVTVKVFCIGAVRFSYVVGWQVEDTPDAAKHQSYHAIWRDNIQNESVCVPANLTIADPSTSGSFVVGAVPYNAAGIPGTGRELMPRHMRLRSDINPTPAPATTGSGLWNINVSVIYGDDDVLIIPAGDVTNITGCIGTNSGGIFCALSELHTAVYRRYN